MNARITANRLLPRLSVVCAMAACSLSGFGASRLVYLMPMVLLYRCQAHDTYFIVGKAYLAIVGIVAAIALPIATLVAERIAKSDTGRIHSGYLLALLGFLLALAMWGVSAYSLLSHSTLCP